MIKKEYIKPIPKYILKLIEKEDKNRYDTRNTTRFYKYLTQYKKELVLITVAVKTHNKQMIAKQVAIHGLDSDICLIKDLNFYCIGGYVVDWYPEGLIKRNIYYKYYNVSCWNEELDKNYNIYAPILNKEYILKFDSFKYSKAELINGHDFLKYLRLYRQYPQVEYLMKMGLKNYVMSKMLLRKLSNDSKFKNWFINNSKEIVNNYFYIDTFFYAYKNNKSLKEAQSYQVKKKSFIKSDVYNTLKQYFKYDEFDKLFKYLEKQNTNTNSYRDYISACDELGIDITIERNRYPKEFKRWHDIRINELYSMRAEQDEKQRKEFYNKFKNIADKYSLLQRNLNDMFITIIAKSPTDLKIEGKILNHCVGSMGYDQKFINEESLIFFIRNKSTPDVPLVTVEYSIPKHKVLQCYGYKDSKPNEEILNYVNKIWLPYANRKIKKVA